MYIIDRTKNLDIPRVEMKPKLSLSFPNLTLFRVCRKIADGEYWCVHGHLDENGNDQWGERFIVKDGNVPRIEAVSTRLKTVNPLVVKGYSYTVSIRKGDTRTTRVYHIDKRIEVDEKIDETKLDWYTEFVKKGDKLLSKSDRVCSTRYEYNPHYTVEKKYLNGKLQYQCHIIELGEGRKLWKKYLLRGGGKILHKTWYTILDPRKNLQRRTDKKYGIETTFGKSGKRRYSFYWCEPKLIPERITSQGKVIPERLGLKAGCIHSSRLDKVLTALQVIIPRWRKYIKHKKSEREWVIVNDVSFI